MTEAKHTRGELSEITHGCDVLLTETGGHSIGLIYREEAAARLVRGWNHLNELDRLKTTPEKVLNLLNRLDEMGVSAEQVPEIIKALTEVQKMCDEFASTRAITNADASRRGMARVIQDIIEPALTKKG